jgi:hypothetical protein
MASNLLLEQLDYVKPYRKDRLRVGLWAIDHPESMPELVRYSFDPSHEKSMQALWGLEFVGRLKLELLYPHLDDLINYLPKVNAHNILRAVSFMCELIAIAYYKNQDPYLGDAFTAKHKTVMTECCFDWLITDQKVACQVRAMTALYHLGTEFDWIHSELEQILRQKMISSSAGYKARGKHISRLIAKFDLKSGSDS